MKSILICAGVLFSAGLARADARMPLWPEGKIPDYESHQFAALTQEAQAKDFKPEAHRMPYVEWLPPPAADRAHGGVMILISGGGYHCLCCGALIADWNRRFTADGFQCVNLVYRSPRPNAGAYYRSAWQDGQRAVRLVRAEAKRRGLDANRIGAIGMSAGAHLAMLLATSSSVPAYHPVDACDLAPCNINFALPCAMPFGLSDAVGTYPSRDGQAIDCVLTDEFKFDAATPSVCFLQGGNDPYSALHSTRLYREFRMRKIPCEVHLFADANHNNFWERDWYPSASGYIRQMNFDRRLGAPVPIARRGITNDVPGVAHARCKLWPEGKTPDFRKEQCEPWYEWWVPAKLTTRAIQIVYSGGGYAGNNPESWDGVPAVRRFLNAKGMAVVVLKYRTPRPEGGLAKHTTAWQDLQRCIRLVRQGADARGLDPNQIGVLGGSAGGHLTLMGATSSRSRSYRDIDAADKLPCNLQWAIATYPAYALTDGIDEPNITGGNAEAARLVPEFAFDLSTCPILFLHGDADGWASMNSVKVWEQLRRMGIQGELHTYAKQAHCFMMNAPEGTGAYLWLDRIWSFLQHKGFAPAQPESASTAPRERADVVIVGSTPAGLSAAVQLTRMGKKAILLSPTDRIGGMTTAGLGRTDVGHPEAFGGIARDFYRGVSAYATGAWSDRAQWCFSPRAALRLLEIMEKKEGLDIRRGERIDRSRVTVAGSGGGRRVTAVATESGKTYEAKLFIDATYEGDLMAAAGVTYAVGREGNKTYGETLNGAQPGKGHHRLASGIDPYVVKGDPTSGLLPGVESEPMGAVGTGDKRLPAYCYRLCITDVDSNRVPFAKPEAYDEREYELLFRHYACGAPANEPPFSLGPLAEWKCDANNTGGVSFDWIGHSARWPEASYAERDQIAAAHKRYQQGLLWTLAHHPRVPKGVRDIVARWGLARDEFTDSDHWPRQIYVREARRLVGEYVMTEHNCRGMRPAPHPVACGAYQMDSHHCRRYVGADGFVHNEGDVQEGEADGAIAPYGIDYGALVPKRGECANLFVPVCLSASHIAYGSMRMEPVFFALGQAAGTAAALALEAACPVQEVDYATLRTRLLADGQVLASKR